MSVGLQREDMSVIATMIDPTCLPTEFSIHRNRRALLSIFSLAPFSNNWVRGVEESFFELLELIEGEVLSLDVGLFFVGPPIVTTIFGKVTLKSR